MDFVNFAAVEFVGAIEAAAGIRKGPAKMAAGLAAPGEVGTSRDHADRASRGERRPDHREARRISNSDGERTAATTEAPTERSTAMTSGFFSEEYAAAVQIERELETEDLVLLSQLRKALRPDKEHILPGTPDPPLHREAFARKPGAQIAQGR